MDRKTLKLPFSPNNSPDWICPTCSKGLLKIKNKTFYKEETKNSREAKSHEAWDPEWIEYIYSCLLICSNPKCKEIVASSGIGSVEQAYVEDEYGQQYPDYIEFFRPKYFNPHLEIISIPKQCHDKAAILLRESFKTFFISHRSSANNIRAAIEEILTDIGVKRFKIVNRKRKPITLHERINYLPSKYSNLKDYIAAVKWLGNAGSHGHSEITIDDVMDAYDLTDYILQEIYNPKSDKLKGLAKKVNQKKGPFRPRKRSRKNR